MFLRPGTGVLEQGHPLRSALGDRYTIERELGRGGMATVYAARDRRHDRPVAIKVMRPGLAAALGPERFAREIATAAQLAHPHIVPVFDSGIIGSGPDAQPYYVMPLIEGRSLRERLDRQGRLSVPEVVAICRDIGGALAFAHEHGVVHRDVKPENILLTGGQALLTDFGIARPSSQGQLEALTSTGIAVGTPAYMSPEQLAGEHRLDGRADLYSLAATGYEALAGERPFAAATPQAELARRMGGSPRPLRASRPDLVAGVDRVFARALAPDPNHRFATVTEFVAALEAAAGPATPGPDRSRRRTATTAALVGLVVVATWLALRRPSRGDDRLGLAVMPFRAPSDAPSLGETLPDLMVTLLAGTPRLRLADPWALWRPLRPAAQDRARSPDPAEAVRLASQSRAERVILGRIDREPRQWRLSIRIYATRRTEEPLHQFTVSAPTDSTESLARQAAVAVLGRIWRETDAPGDPGLEAGSLTRSPEALKSYLAARDAMRRGQPDSADAAIQHALSLDSTFALAAIEAVTIRSWSQFLRGQPFRGLRELVRIAAARVDSLPERDRIRLEAAQAGIETDGPRAAAAWRRLIDLDSTNLEAWNALSYVHLVNGWQYGATETDIRQAIDRSLALDSSYVPALFRRGQLAPVAANDADARAMIEVLRAREQGSPLLRGSRLGLEALVATDQEFAAMLASLIGVGPLEWGSIFRRLRAFRPDRALILATRTRETETPGFKLTFAANGEAGLLAALGRWPTIDSLLAAGTTSAVPAFDQALDWKRVAAGLAGFPDQGIARSAAAMAARLPIDSAAVWIPRASVWKTGWLLGAYHAALGDPGWGERWRAVMDRMPVAGAPEHWGQAGAADIGSRAAERAGKADSAAALAAQAFRLWDIHGEGVQDDDPEPAFRYRFALTLIEAGRRDSAAILLRSLIPPASWIGYYTTAALVTLGDLARDAADRAAAARYYDWALSFLELGGESTRPWLERARAGLAAVGPARGFRFGR